MTENIKEPSKEQKEMALEYVINTIKTNNSYLGAFLVEVNNFKEFPDTIQNYGEITNNRCEKIDKSSVELALEYLFIKGYITHVTNENWNSSIPIIFKDIGSEDNKAIISDDNWLPNESKHTQDGFQPI